MCLDIQQLIDDGIIRVGQTKKEVLEIIGMFDEVRGGNKIWQPNIWLVGPYEFHFEDRHVREVDSPPKLLKVIKQVL